MKPDVGAGDCGGTVDEPDVDPCELFVAVGMLVLESRLPTASVKGRRDGLHCPQAVGHWTSHDCDVTQSVCEKAARVQKQMQTLWRNRVPMCIEVLLFADCQHGHIKASSTEVAPPDPSDSSVLLEQWTVQNVARKTSEPVSSARCLFQAVRSYLHFSQLSAWLNATHGTAPKYIGYRVSPPAEFCTSRFSIPPELHVFPSAVISRTSNLRVTVQLLPRVPDIPRPICHEPHYDEPSFEDGVLMFVRQKSPDFTGNRTRSSSPRFTKPNVLSHMTVSSQYQKSEACGSPISYSVCSSDTYHESDSCGEVVFQTANNDTLASGYSRTCSFLPSTKHCGAVPKRFTLPLQSTMSEVCCDVAYSEPLDPVAAKISQCKAAVAVAPSVLALQKSAPKPVCYAARRRSMPPKDGGTDSDSSSPDIDAYLSTTLASCRLDPLSPQEMDGFLSRMYPQRMHKFKSVGSSLKLDWTDVVDGGCEPSRANIHDHGQPLCSSANLAQRKPKGIGYRTPPSRRRTSASVNDDDDHLATDLLRPQDNAATSTDCESPVGDDAVFDDENVFDGLPGSANRQLLYSKCDVVSPKFLVGDDCADVAKSVVQSNGVVSKLVNAAPAAFHKSISCPNKKVLGAIQPPFHKGSSLLKSVTKKEMTSSVNVNESATTTRTTSVNAQPIPSSQDVTSFRQCLQKGANALFHVSTGLPLQSSPAPIKRTSSNSFDYDSSLNSVRSIKNSLSCVSLDKQDSENKPSDHCRRTYSTSAPATTNCLLGNFEESMLNGRIEPSGAVEGFTVDIGASGSFCPKHITLPVAAFFFSLSDDNAPSPYLGHISLDSLPRRGYHVPSKGTVQVTLFNPNKTVVKMFVVVYDLSDMPANCQTFLRQRTLYMPVKGSPSDLPNVMIYLRYLIHLRFASSKSGKIYLHTDIRVIFARDKFELDSRVANYELRSFTEGPENPKYAPKRQ